MSLPLPQACADLPPEPVTRTLSLESYAGARPPAPDWFVAAQAVPCHREPIRVEGAELELLCWGERGQPGILLLHGAMAHARWWTAVAPLLAQGRRVCSLSFSGAGGSDRREHYSVEMMAREARAALEVGGLFDAAVPPVLAAHSFGGKVASLVVGDAGGERLLGAMLIDSFIDPKPALGNPPVYRYRSYASEAEAVVRFRLSPDQPSAEPYILDAIARGGLRQEPDGTWTWHYDPNYFAKLDYRSGWDEICAARCQLAFLRGELSNIVTPEIDALQRRSLRNDTQFIEIPAAHHHIMVDQPLALTAAMRAIWEGWLVRLDR